MISAAQPALRREIPAKHEVMNEETSLRSHECLEQLSMVEFLGWSAQDLQGRRKGDLRKVRLAARLRRETSMTLEWIGERLWMVAAPHIVSLLQRYQQKGPNGEEAFKAPRPGFA
jgi:hypothetical protein